MRKASEMKNKIFKFLDGAFSIFIYDIINSFTKKVSNKGESQSE